MNNIFIARSARSLALLCALASVAALSGCGGGTAVAPLGPQQPTGNSGVALPATAFRLPSGQLALLNLSYQGNAANGTLRVVDTATTQSAVPAGIYPVAGDFSAPGSFALSGRVANAGDLSLSGTLPAGNTDGNYNFTSGSISQSGVLSSRGLIGTPTSYAATGDLRFSDFSARGPLNQLSDYPFDFVPVTTNGAGAFNASPSSSLNDGGFQYTAINGAIRQGIQVTGTRVNRANPRQDVRIEISVGTIPGSANSPFLRQGQSFDLANPVFQTNGTNTESVANLSLLLNGFRYSAIAGTLTLKSLTNTSATFELRDVKVANSNSFPGGNSSGFPNDGQPISTFIVNGSIGASGLPTSVVNQ